jgi:hypothetical protein
MPQLPDPLPEVESGPSKAGRIMPTQNIVHNPAGETGHQDGPQHGNPTGDGDTSAGNMPQRENPC